MKGPQPPSIQCGLWINCPSWGCLHRAPMANGDHPLETRPIERRAAPAGSLLQVRSQRSLAANTELGRFGDWLGAVSDTAGASLTDMGTPRPGRRDEGDELVDVARHALAIRGPVIQPHAVLLCDQPDRSPSSPHRDHVSVV